MTSPASRLIAFAGLGRANPVTILAVALLAAVALVNALQFPLIEDNSTRMTRAVYRFESDDIFELSIPYAGNERSRYAVHVALAQLAPDSEYVTVATDGSFRSEFVRRVMGYGMASSYEAVVGDPHETLAAAHLEGSVVATGDAGFRGPAFVIAIAGRHSTVDAEDYVDELLRDGRSAAPTGAAERFVVIELPLPESTANDKAIWYIIDVALIDDPRAEEWFA